MSDTPRTDAILPSLTILTTQESRTLLEHARTLERELAEANVCEAENFRRAEENLKRAESWEQSYRNADRNGRASQASAEWWAEQHRQKAEYAVARLEALRSVTNLARDAVGWNPEIAGNNRAYQHQLDCIERIAAEAIAATGAVVNEPPAAPSVAQEPSDPMTGSTNRLLVQTEGWTREQYCARIAALERERDALIPPGYTHALDCAYKASVRNHCTCGYVDKGGA